MSKVFRKSLVPAVALTAWLAAIVCGFLSFHSFDQTPGADPLPIAGWPAQGALARQFGVTELVMAVHPRCPCTRASVQVLGEILQAASRPARTRVLLYRPEASTVSWSAAAFLRIREAIPSAIVLDDAGGRNSQRFGLRSSGSLVVFDPAGQPLFRGGLTVSSSAADRSAGGDAVASILQGQPPGIHFARNFGCALRSTPWPPGRTGKTE